MNAPSPLTRDTLEALDREDPIARFRDAYEVPEGILYLDGNSLGALPKATSARVASAIGDEWGKDLIKGWRQHGWMQLPYRIGDKIANMIGAAPGQTVAIDSTSINLFKLFAAALRMAPGRKTILSVDSNFPTDLYMAEGLVQLLGQDYRLRLVGRHEIAHAIDRDTALVTLTHVDFKTAEIYDMAGITDRAHREGALILWDLCHSAGAVPVELDKCGADFAVGCGYKYLNGGPGAPAFLYVASHHQEKVQQPLSGWLGHKDPFAFETHYRPARGIARTICSTPAVLGLTALECGVDLLLEAGLARLRAKSMKLTDLFIHLVEQQCSAFGFTIASPREATSRGSQVSIRHPAGYSIMQALIARGVIGDFRAPDFIRFGFAPSYLRFVDIWDSVEILRQIMAESAFERPEFKVRAAVT
ncbi:MAG TPA: kynureninase [Alphaproteobacteria bacterium]|nr:kynureninase [Alphaproteobacteria bacterium]